MHINNSRISGKIIIPDSAQQQISRQHSAFMSAQIEQRVRILSVSAQADFL